MLRDGIRGCTVMRNQKSRAITEYDYRTAQTYNAKVGCSAAFEMEIIVRDIWFLVGVLRHERLGAVNANHMAESGELVAGVRRCPHLHRNVNMHFINRSRIQTDC